MHGRKTLFARPPHFFSPARSTLHCPSRSNIQLLPQQGQRIRSPTASSTAYSLPDNVFHSAFSPGNQNHHVASLFQRSNTLRKTISKWQRLKAMRAIQSKWQRCQMAMSNAVATWWFWEGMERAVGGANAL